MTVKTALCKGQILDSGFEILGIEELAEFDALGIWARHKKSGAEVFHVLNDDNENLFSFSFATPSMDSTGAAHILEHSVLCGSKNYPLKDTFLVLAQGSLQTFLNAWTFPDKTLYPASSVNEHDYFNLMSVYGDAVFRPLLSEWTFMQEGHHLFFEGKGKNKKLNISGVVYNEMKGSYSSLDTYAGLWSVKAVFPDTPYDFESGGDPECIPDLTWEGLKAFHKACYSPANCRVFLAGNIPTEKQLAFLNEKFFASIEAGKKVPAIKKAERWTSPRSFRIPCPSGAEQKPTVILSWLCGDAADSDETLSLAALAEILLGHDGSPLTRALIDSGLGEDLSPVSGLEGELRETVFSAGLRGVGVSGKANTKQNIEEAAKKVEALILGELTRLAKEGIPKEEIEAALLGMEFSNREIRRSGGPFSLVWMRRSLRGWLHGEKPWNSLLFTGTFNRLKKHLADDGCYFEKMINRFLLENNHRAFITIEPAEGFREKKDAAFEKRLEEISASLGEDGEKAVIRKAEELEAFQEKEDSAEILAGIPHLSRKDLSPEIEQIKREYADLRGTPAIIHPVFTNGITYSGFAIPVDILPPEDYPWLPLYARAAVSVGLPGMDYGKVSTLLARTTGGFNATLQSGSAVPGASRSEALPSGIFDIKGRDWIIFRLKALDGKTEDSLSLARSMITEADFSDLRRLKDLVLELKNDLDSSLAPSGHIFAAGRSGRFFSRARAVEELWNGIDQIIFAHKLISLDISEIAEKLKEIQAKLRGAGALVNIAAGDTAKAESETGKSFGSFGPPRPRNPGSCGSENFYRLSETKSQAGKPEIFTSPSLQVGFASVSLLSLPYGSPLQAAGIVLGHLLSTGSLWEDIRVKGGAYGAFAHCDNLEGPFSLSTYRDPNPLRSIDVFSSLLGKESAHKNKDGLEKAVIGTYARETHPRAPAEKSIVDFLRFLYGIEASHRAKRLKDLIAVTEEQIDAVLKDLTSQTGSTYPVILTGKTDAEKAAAKLGAQIIELPV